MHAWTKRLLRVCLVSTCGQLLLTYFIYLLNPLPVGLLGAKQITGTGT